MNSVFEWASRHGISQAAVAELLALMEPERPTGTSTETSEAAVQAGLQVRAARGGGALWRNNSGSLQDAEGRWVRFGLANTSKKLNKVFKSSDLIGITPTLITPQMVGAVFGRFTAVECKEPGWRGPRPSNEREQAQGNYLKTVRAMGGIGLFAQSIEDVFQ